MVILKSKNKNFADMKDLFQQTNIGIDKIVVTNKVSFGRKGFKYFIGYKDDKKSDLYAYFSQKWVHIEETLMKLNVYLFE